MVHPWDAAEPMFHEEEGRSRYVVHPVRHHDMYALAEVAEKALWTTGEVDLSRDTADLIKLSEPLRRLVLVVLAFFAASDGIVNENLGQRFSEEVKWPEARLFYALQIGIEAIHSKMYSMLITTYVPDAAERHRLFNAIETMPCVAAKARWAIKYSEASDIPFCVRVVAFTIVEGLFFSSSFCAIYYFREMGILPGLTFSNELIARDEGLHVDFGVLMHKNLVHKAPWETVREMAAEAFAIEAAFVDDAMPKAAMVGMNAELMKTYGRYTVNRLLARLEYPPLFDARDPNCPPCHMPFDFMENLGTEGKTNFFEARVSEYQKKAGGSTPQIEQGFSMDPDF